MAHTLVRTTRAGQLVYRVDGEAVWVEQHNGGYRHFGRPDAQVFATPEAVLDAYAAKIAAFQAGQPAPIGYCHYCGQGIYDNRAAVVSPLGGYQCRECQ